MTELYKIVNINGETLYECEVPQEIKPSERFKYATKKAKKDGVDLTGELIAPDFTGAVVTDEDFMKIKPDYFAGADLESADLRGANLKRFDPSGMNLEVADLLADLVGANSHLERKKKPDSKIIKALKIFGIIVLWTAIAKLILFGLYLIF